LTHRGLKAGGFVCLTIGIAAVLIALPGEGVRNTIHVLLVIGGVVATVGASLLLLAFLLRRVAHVPEMPAPDMRHTALVHTLRRIGVSEHRPQVGEAGLFSEPVLLVGEKRIYDQDGTRRGTFRPAADNPSLFKQVFSESSCSWEILDDHEQVLLTVREGREAEPVRHGLKQIRPQTFKAIASDGSEIGMVVLRLGWRRQQRIEAAGENIGALVWISRRVYGVRDGQDNEVGRITHQSISLLFRRPECIVIEMYDAMPDGLRQVMLAASKAVAHLNAPSA
jgi:hypothetical protein